MVLLFALSVWPATFLLAQTSSSSSSSSSPASSPQHSDQASEQRPVSRQKLVVTVTDENGVAVASARAQLQPPAPAFALRCETDFAGHCEFVNLAAGAYELQVEKIGYYASSPSNVQVGLTADVEVTLSHQREAHEVVNVVESPPAIDPAQISSKEGLTGSQIIDIPYPGAHDYRNALTYIPGVTPDAFGQPHVAGAESYQTWMFIAGVVPVILFGLNFCAARNSGAVATGLSNHRCGLAGDGGFVHGRNSFDDLSIPWNR